MLALINYSIHIIHMNDTKVIFKPLRGRHDELHGALLCVKRIALKLEVALELGRVGAAVEERVLRPGVDLRRRFVLVRTQPSFALPVHDQKCLAVQHDALDVVVVAEDDLGEPDAAPLLVRQQVEVLVHFQVLHLQAGVEPGQFESNLTLPETLQLFDFKNVADLRRNVHWNREI